MHGTLTVLLVRRRLLRSRRRALSQKELRAPVVTTNSETILIQQSVSTALKTWRFVLRERRDGTSSLRLDILEKVPEMEKERATASFIVLSSGDAKRLGFDGGM